MEQRENGGADDFSAKDPAARAAREFFGIPYLYPWQRLVIASILDSAADAAEQDAETDRRPAGNRIVLLPTGAGKSLCFQIPALLLNGPTLVIYPLLALMADQKRRLDEANVRNAVFRGGQSAEEREENFRRIRNGARIILANPEALAAGNLAGRLSKCGVAHIAIDEAHCVSEWGGTFRPAYLEMGRIVRAIGAPVVTAFTATASPNVLARISDILFDGNAQVIRSDSDRPNIRYSVKNAAAKQQAVLTLAQTKQRPMLAFCLGAGMARFYHAGLDREEKKDVESWFFSRSDAILCATCAYGMGVDKRNIRTVVHLAPPDTAEAYIQEAGRGGRDGAAAEAILLWNYADHVRFKRFPHGSRMSAIRLFAESSTCRRQILLDALGAEQTACSGCDICDSAAARKNSADIRISARMNRTVPRAAVPDDAETALALIRRRPRHYTAETLENALLDILNRESQEKIGIAVWDHAACAEIIGELLSGRKIIRCAFPWRGRFRPNPYCSCSGSRISAGFRSLSFCRSIRRGFRRSLWRVRPAAFRLRRTLAIVRDKAAKIHVQKNDNRRSNHNMIRQDVFQDRHQFGKIHILRYSARFKIGNLIPLVYIGKNSGKNHLQEASRFNIFKT